MIFVTTEFIKKSLNLVISGGKIKTINNALTFKTKTINKLEECVNLDTGVDAYAKELCAHIHSCHLCRYIEV